MLKSRRFTAENAVNISVASVNSVVNRRVGWGRVALRIYGCPRASPSFERCKASSRFFCLVFSLSLRSF